MKKILYGAAALVTLGGFIGGIHPSYAQQPSFQETKLIVSRISESQAKEIALKQVQGKVMKVELETENGVQVYEVDVQAPDKLYEVKVDANSGKVLKVEPDND